MLIASAPLVVSAMANQNADRPNILWISVEDIGPVLGCYGVEGIHTPNIDRLANEGIRYTHAYSTVGVCAPSRSSIITGMYPVSIGSHQMRTSPHYAARAPENVIYETYRGLYDTKGRNVPEYAVVPPPHGSQLLQHYGTRPADTTVAARAVRIGYKTSGVTSSLPR